MTDETKTLLCIVGFIVAFFGLMVSIRLVVMPDQKDVDRCIKENLTFRPGLEPKNLHDAELFFAGYCIGKYGMKP